MVFLPKHKGVKVIKNKVKNNLYSVMMFLLPCQRVVKVLSGLHLKGASYLVELRHLLVFELGDMDEPNPSFRSR